MFNKKNNCVPEVEEKKVDFCDEMTKRCTPQKLLSVAGIAVFGYVVEVGLKVLTGTLTDQCTLRHQKNLVPSFITEY